VWWFWGCSCRVSMCVTCYLFDITRAVEPAEGIPEIWFQEPFPHWGVFRFRVRVRFTYG